MLSLIAQIHWRPGIGDPSIVGWLTVSVYFLSCLFSVACAIRLGDKNSIEEASPESKLWWLIALALLLLGINKQLDLQTLLTEIGKALAKKQGWYEQRRGVQEVFIAIIVCGGIFSLLVVWRACRLVWKDNWLTIVGLAVLVGFIFIRATSFHGVDRMLGVELSGFKMNWILELAGIICVGFSAVLRLKRTEKKEVSIGTERRLTFL
ncbi:MAG: hypothetical protein JW925_14115 [Syntrophaceae bacterium]|nr:hypothetical protein [Syntrophaceae bacterium]